MSRSDPDPASSTLRLLGYSANMAGHLGLCRGVAMHAGLSRRYYADGRPPQGLPPGWTPCCNPGFLVRALQDLLGEIRDQEVRRLCERFIAQARDLDGVNEALAALLATEASPTQDGAWAARPGCAPLAARLQAIEEESERLWEKLLVRLAQLGGEEPRPLQA